LEDALRSPETFALFSTIHCVANERKFFVSTRAAEFSKKKKKTLAASTTTIDRQRCTIALVFKRKRERKKRANCML
jgi:hypothetical protein